MTYSLHFFVGFHPPKFPKQTRMTVRGGETFMGSSRHVQLRPRNGVAEPRGSRTWKKKFPAVEQIDPRNADGRLQNVTSCDCQIIEA